MAESHPASIQSPASKSPEHKLLLFFLSMAILLVCGLSQVVLKRLFRLWVPLKPEKYIDLCSVANVSVVLMDENFHG